MRHFSASSVLATGLVTLSLSTYVVAQRKNRLQLASLKQQELFHHDLVKDQKVLVEDMTQLLRSTAVTLKKIDGEPSAKKITNLDVIFALSSVVNKELNAYGLTPETISHRTGHLVDIEKRFSRCVTLLARLEQLARMQETVMDIDASQFPMDIVMLARSISCSELQKPRFASRRENRPHFVAAIHKYFAERGPEGELALAFLQRVEVTGVKFAPEPWTADTLERSRTDYMAEIAKKPVKVVGASQ